MKELQSKGLYKFVFDPDRGTTMKILQEHLRSIKDIAEPLVADWTESRDVIPLRYSYMSIVEYLVKRQIAIIDATGRALSAPVMLPTAEKPLVKGHNLALFCSHRASVQRVQGASATTWHPSCLQ